MAKQKQHRHIILLLLGLSLVVWGVILKQLYWGITWQPEMPPLERQSTNSSAISSKSSLYGSGLNINRHLRDVFRPKLTVTPAVKKSPQLSLKVTPPQIKYIAFLADTRGNLALLADKYGQTKICAVGDSIGGVALQQIGKERIEGVYRGQPLEIEIANAGRQADAR